MRSTAPLDRIRYIAAFAVVLALAPVTRAARAATPARAAYALLVGANRGGPGQKPLRFAHRDAKRLRKVLLGLGGYDAKNVELALEPDRKQLLAAFDRAASRLAAARKAGQRPLFVFFYSGHARARALNLGSEELPLADLRRRLLELPSTATVAILDACQTGAISRIKGAAPTADFSFNSARDLDTAGVAVMASSSASELSQEADTLRSSYFTHHLLVGLRGAADDDENGRVTLSEAYRYAYDRTLIATARTAVGKQHVTLETRLRGKGEMVLTFPARATSALMLPRTLAAEVLVHRPPARHVMAEVHKAAGKTLRLALPPGRYVALVQRKAEKGLRRCQVALYGGAIATLDAAGCTLEEPTAVLAKGASGPSWPRWSLEVGLAILGVRTDAYDKRLDDFGFDRQSDLFDLRGGLSVALGWQLTRYLSIGARFAMFDSSLYRRNLEGLSGDKRTQSFEWSTYGVGAFFRGRYPFFDGIVQPYAQAGAGVAFATTLLTDPLQASTVQDDQLEWGYYLSAGVGLAVMPWRHIGGFIQLDVDYAPVVKNLVGDTHDSGGVRLTLGLRGAL